MGKPIRRPGSRLEMERKRCREKEIEETSYTVDATDKYR